MNCRKVSHLLSAYMDGELPGVEYRQIHEHLAYCQECATEYTSLLRMKRMLGRLRMQDPRPELPGVILRNIRIDEEHRSEPITRRWLRHWDRHVRTNIVTPQTVGLGVGLAVIAVLLTVQVFGSSGNAVRVVGPWEHTVPPASDFVAGVNYAATNRFVPPVYTMRPSQPAGTPFDTIEPLMPSRPSADRSVSAVTWLH